MVFSRLPVLSIALAICCSHLGCAHTFLTRPDAYNRVFQLRDCVGSECSQACPSRDGKDMRNTPDEPAAVWKRGEEVTISWARNNHRTGFVRLAIVPVKRQMDRDAHRKLALFHGCFDQGMHACEGELCGADKGGIGYKRNMTVPTIFPNGLYVFALVWYGGIHSPLADGRFFSDYWSCSYIRIHGGEKCGGEYQPYFEAGADNVQARKHGGKCLTGVDEPGVCPNDGCTGPHFHGLPKEYQNGTMPKFLTRRDVVQVMEWTERQV